MMTFGVRILHQVGRSRLHRGFGEYGTVGHLALQLQQLPQVADVILQFGILLLQHSVGLLSHGVTVRLFGIFKRKLHR